jgi:amidase
MSAGMTPQEYSRLDAVALAELVRTGRIPPEAPSQAALAAAETLNPALNAIVGFTPEETRRALAALDRRAPLAGVPFLVKDIGMAMAGIPQQMGSRFVTGFVPPADSELARRFKASGVVTIGRSNTPEFGCNLSTEPVLFGPTRNPWKPDRSPAGSSGGAAAAVAAGIVPIAHANDGGGSIRAPASACGLVGLKPSRGRLPVAPDGQGMVFGLGQEFIVSRSVRDSAATLEALSTPPDRGARDQVPIAAEAYAAALARPPQRLRIAMTQTTSAFPAAHPDCLAAVQSAAALCEELGHTIEEAEPTVDVAEGIRLWMHFSSAFGAWMIGLLEQMLGRKAERALFERSVFGLFETGRRMSLPAFIGGFERMNVVTRALSAFFDRYDVWLTPTMLQPPPALGVLNADDPELPSEEVILRWGGWAGFLPLYNVSGFPGITLPLHVAAEGLPIGVHFGAALGEEGTLLRLAAELEAARPWRERCPPLHVAAPRGQAAASRGQS